MKVNIEEIANGYLVEIEVQDNAAMEQAINRGLKIVKEIIEEEGNVVETIEKNMSEFSYPMEEKEKMFFNTWSDVSTFIHGLKD